jgi:NADPH:quinone reductase-like Zn-dependent oxidoreductase
MRAMIFEEFGGPDVLHLAEVAEPHAGPGQVRIRVETAGVNPIDVKIRSGAMRAVFPTPLPAIVGADVAGIVDEIGPGVDGLAVGDEVLGWADTGSYAEYALATKVTRKPAELAWDVAVALPVAGETARRGLDLLAVAAGETLLVHGGAGAVGTIAVQLAVRRGARVIATASPRNHDYLRSLGATPVSYGAELEEQVRALGLAARPGAPHGIDAVFDVAGKGALPVSIELRGGTTRIVTIADMRAGELGVTFSSGTRADQSPAALAELAQSVVAGEVVIAIAGRFPLVEAARAQEMSAAGHHRGKVVLVVRDA